jgi:hypothetical protein
VDAGLVFLIDIVAHGVTADTERFGVRCFQRGVESTPENDASEKAERQNKPRADLGRLAQRRPIPSQKSWSVRHFRSFDFPVTFRLH